MTQLTPAPTAPPTTAAGGRWRCCASRWWSSPSTPRSSTWRFPTWSAVARHDHRAGCSGSSTPTRWCSPACCSPREPRATASAAGGARAGLVVFGVGSRGSALADSATAHRDAGGHRRRRGADLPGHAVDPHQRVHRPGRAPAGHRRVGRHRRHRHRARPGGRRGAAAPLLLGLDLLGERPGVRRSRWSAGARSFPRPRDPVHRRLDLAGALLSIVGLSTLVFGIIEGPQRRLDQRRGRRRASRSGLVRARVFARAELRTPPSDARPAPVPQPPLRRRQPGGHRASTSACSAPSSSRPSTSSSCSATTRSAPGSAACRSPWCCWWWPTPRRGSSARFGHPRCDRHRPGRGRGVAAAAHRVDARHRLRDRAAQPVPFALGMGLTIAPPPPRSWARCRRRTPAWDRPSTTPPARSAARSAWR